MKVKTKAKPRKAKKETMTIFTPKQLTICIHSFAKFMAMQQDDLDSLFLKISRIEETLAQNAKNNRKAKH